MKRKILAACLMLVLALVIGAGLISITRALADLGGNAPSGPALSTQAGKSSPRDAVLGMLGRLNRARAVKDLRRLTGDEQLCTMNGCTTIADRMTAGEGLRWAMDYLFEQTAGLGYRVEFHEWTRSGKTDRNLIARKVGAVAPNEEIYLVAHVDGIKLAEGQRFPSADDNASGTADVLEVARVLSTQTFSRTLVLLFSTGEEQGARGVKKYLEQMSAAELSRIKVVVDVDMVGYDANDDGVMQLWYGEDPAALAVTHMMSETIRSYGLGLVPTIVGGCD